MNTRTNALLIDWDTPFGIPPFEAIEVSDFEPAFEEALRQHSAEVQHIAQQSEPADFDNTIAALERSGQLLRRVESVFDNLCSSRSSPALQEVERRMAPVLAAHQSRIRLDTPLFARIDSLHARRQALALDPESLRVLERYHLDFVLAGARLGPAERSRLSEIAEALAALYAEFSQNVLADEGEFARVLRSADELKGLPDFVRAAARQAALERGLQDDQAHVITLSRSSLMPFMTFSEHRALREELWRAWCQRGERLASHHNHAVILRILRLRQEQARLLGHPSYAHKALADTMAGSPQAVQELLDRVWTPACRLAEQEYAAMQALAQRTLGLEQPPVLQAWDWHHWAEKVRAERYALEEEDIKPYLQLGQMTQAMFHVARQLFGLSFTPLEPAPRYIDTLRAWDVTDAQGRHVGVFMADNFARTGKRSGAWMSTFRDASSLDKAVRPLVLNNNNFSSPAAGQDALLSLDDARTLFHEFGHGLHGLLSRCRYPRLTGTAVLRDFVEFPSQILENWLLQPQILRQFAHHHETGEAMPEALIERILKASTFNQGFATVEYTASALADLALHQVQDLDGLDLTRFEHELQQSLGMPSAIGLRHRLPHFLHLFASDGYASAYYVYLWAEVLEADGFQAFVEKGDIFDPELARRLHDHIFSRGNAVAPMQAYEAFRGRAPTVDALMKARGLQ
jgi:peptidyl-dipeptidase Dcp